ncbi:MAG: hypothetical protein K2O18_04575 [Oscillospiraceae bacterium]|nr:hypothetical protein [Oscillospiraceae bacterium]
MTTPIPYAHRMHYKLTPSDYAALHTRLSAAVPGRAAAVHTLRFASYRFTNRWTQNAAENLRFSLHYYDNDPTYLQLVRQQGEEYTYTMVAEAECRALLSGDTDWLLGRSNPVLQDFYECLTGQMLLPQVMMTCRREIYRLSNLDLWVALDTDIRTSLEHMKFLDPEQLALETAEQEGQYLMELSYSDTIPDNILCILEETAPRRQLLAATALPA